MEKFFKKQKQEVTKVRFKLKTNGMLDMKHNHYTMSSTLTLIARQTDLFIQIVSDWWHNSSSGSVATIKLAVK